MTWVIVGIFYAFLDLRSYSLILLKPNPMRSKVVVFKVLFFFHIWWISYTHITSILMPKCNAHNAFWKQSRFFANLLMPTNLTKFSFIKGKDPTYFDRSIIFFWENELFIRTGRTVRYRVAVLISRNWQQRALYSTQITKFCSHTFFIKIPWNVNEESCC